MFKKLSNIFPLFIASRLSATTGKKRSGIASWIGIIGVTLSLLTIILTVSIVNGFKNELIEKITALYPKVYIYNIGGDYRDTEDDLLLIKQTVDKRNDMDSDSNRTHIVLQVPALLKSDANFATLILQGYSNTEDLHNFLDKWTELPIDSLSGKGIILSEKAATDLQLKVNDVIDVAFPSTAGLKFRRLKVEGIYATNVEEYDGNMALCNADILASLTGSITQSIIRLDFHDLNANKEELLKFQSDIRATINRLYGHGIIHNIYGTGNIFEDAASFFGWLQLLNTNIVVIVILMSLISLFTLICSLTIIVLEYIPTIGLLKSLGITNRSMKNIFLILGMRIVLISILVSNLLAIIIITLQSGTHFIQLDADAYYMQFLPVKMDFIEFLIIDLSSLLLAYISMMVPASIIKKISPARVIRYS